MWWRDLTQLPALMRENNQLLRELIEVTSGKPAMTRTTASPRPRPAKIYTDKDVSQVTPAMRQQQAIAAARNQLPHVPATPTSPTTPEGFYDHSLEPNGSATMPAATAAPKTDNSSS